MSYFHLRGRGSVAGLCEGALSSAGPGRAEKEENGSLQDWF